MVVNQRFLDDWLDRKLPVDNQYNLYKHFLIVNCNGQVARDGCNGPSFKLGIAYVGSDSALRQPSTIDGLKWPFFLLLSSSLLLGYETHTISTKWLANPNRGYSRFPHDFWSSYEYLIYYQSENSCAL